LGGCDPPIRETKWIAENDGGQEISCFAHNLLRGKQNGGPSSVELCGELVRRGLMSEPRPCRLFKYHRFQHSPDLTGLIFGNLVVKGMGSSLKGHPVTWVVEQKGRERQIRADLLLSGTTVGKQEKSGLSRTAEYHTVHSHFDSIFKRDEPGYKGMPFHEAWNPEKGGAYWVGAQWIIENLGHKPGRSWSLDIIDHAKGFVPGNLRWALKHTQEANKIHRKLGSFSIEELRAEALRHGYELVPLARNQKQPLPLAA